MVTIYPAIFFKEEDGGYTVVFPDLNHLASQGDDLDEAMYMAKQGGKGKIEVV